MEKIKLYPTQSQSVFIQYSFKYFQLDKIFFYFASKISYLIVKLFLISFLGFYIVYHFQKLPSNFPRCYWTCPPIFIDISYWEFGLISGYRDWIINIILYGNFGKSWRNESEILELVILYFMGTFGTLIISIIASLFLKWSSTKVANLVNRQIIQVVITLLKSIPYFIFAIIIIVYSWKENGRLDFIIYIPDKDYYELFWPKTLMIFSILVILTTFSSLNLIESSLKSDSFIGRWTEQSNPHYQILEHINIIKSNIGLLISNLIFLQYIFNFPSYGKILIRAAKYYNLPVILAIFVSLTFIGLILNLILELSNDLFKSQLENIIANSD